MNAYFKNQHFENDNLLLFIFDEKEEKQLKHTLFSRYEDYFLYKGLDRGISKPLDYIKYANIYIRADTTKTIVKRKYQKLMEFFADASSLLIALFRVITIIFSFINNFYAEHSLSKKVFFFKEVENKHFNINRKAYKIKHLLNLTKQKHPTLILNNDENNKTSSEKKNIDINREKINNCPEINIYNQKKNNKLKYNEEEKIEEFLRQIDIIKFGKKKFKKRIKQKINFSPKNYEIEGKKNISPVIQQSTKRKVLNQYEIQPIPTAQMTFKASPEFDLKKLGKINFSYNLFEILLSYCGKNCKSDKLKVKNNLTEKAKNILNCQLDISLYVKNTILIDIINRTLINENIKKMAKFLSWPIISVNKNGKRDIDDIYKDYTAINFDKLYEDIINVEQNNRVSKEEKQIISLVYNKLEEML